MNRFLPTVALAGTVCALTSCFSPKRPMLATDIYSRAGNRYELANSALAAGNLEDAGAYFQEAYDLATSIDNAELLCRVCLSIVVYRMDLPDGAEEDMPFGRRSVSDLIAEATMYAEWAGSTELTGLCKIYAVKVELSQKKLSRGAVAKHIEELEPLVKQLSKSPYYLGYLHRTLGDLHMAQQAYTDAAAAYGTAAAIHTKHRYLYEIGLDWYYVAQAYSRNGDKEQALDAIFKALKYDRDAENAAAIAADYNAYAQILLKGRPSKEEKSLAEQAKQRSQQILEAAGFGGQE